MREKLIDVFMHMGDHIRSLDEYGFVYDSTLAQAIEDVVAMLKKPDANVGSKWISVKDRLPEENQYVLCFVLLDGGWEGKRIKTTFHYGDGRFLKDKPTDCITHWMPLPEPPKGE